MYVASQLLMNSLILKIEGIEKFIQQLLGPHKLSLANGCIQFTLFFVQLSCVETKQLLCNLPPCTPPLLICPHILQGSICVFHSLNSEHTYNSLFQCPCMIQKEYTTCESLEHLIVFLNINMTIQCCHDPFWQKTIQLISRLELCIMYKHMQLLGLEWLQPPINLLCLACQLPNDIPEPCCHA